MAVNFDVSLQQYIFDFYAVTCTFRPLMSQPGAPDYAARGILNTYPIDVIGMDNSITSDQKTIFDIRDSEFTIQPAQGDHLIVPYDCNGAAKGEYEILDGDSDGGGQTMLTIRKWGGW